MLPIKKGNKKIRKNSKKFVKIYLVKTFSFWKNLKRSTDFQIAKSLATTIIKTIQ